MPDRIVMPPVQAAERQAEPGHDRHPERGQGAHAEHVDPGRDIGGLAVGQQLGGRQRPHRAAPQPGRPHAGRAVIGRQHGHSGPIGIHGRAGRLRPFPLGKRKQQRGPEDSNHDRDQDQVGDRDVKDRPVHEGGRLIHVIAGTGTADGQILT